MGIGEEVYIIIPKWQLRPTDTPKSYHCFESNSGLTD